MDQPEAVYPPVNGAANPNQTESGRRNGHSGRPGSTSLHGSACDSCRRRRVKCNSEQPCNRCIQSAISCTYGNVIARSSGVGYTRHLERRVADLESLLERITRETASQSVSNRGPEATQPLEHLAGISEDFVYRAENSAESTSSFYGSFSGLNVLRVIVDHLRDTHAILQEQHSAKSSGVQVIQAFESVLTGQNLTAPIRQTSFVTLPSATQVQALIDRALTYALIGHDCFDRQDLEHHQHRVLNVDPEDRTMEDRESLALVYAFLALGRQLARVDDGQVVEEKSGLAKGAAYFQASCEIQELIAIDTLCSIQINILQTKYLLSAFMTSQAYVRLQTGIAIARHMGLQISDPNADASAFTRDELIKRRAVFATINMMDTYLSSILGISKTLQHQMPKSLCDESFEECPTGSSDTLMSQDRLSSVATARHYQRLAGLMAKILRQRCSLKFSRDRNSEDADVPSGDGTLIAEVEVAVDQWHAEFTAIQDTDADAGTLMAQLSILLLHLAVKGMLYRPYLNHLANDFSDPKFNLQAYEYGSKCIVVAMQIVGVIDSLLSNHVLYSGHWTAVYMLVYASSILCYFIKTSKNRVTVQESRLSLSKARELLLLLGKHNTAARKCLDTIEASMRPCPLKMDY